MEGVLQSFVQHPPAQQRRDQDQLNVTEFFNGEITLGHDRTVAVHQAKANSQPGNHGGPGAVGMGQGTQVRQWPHRPQ